MRERDSNPSAPSAWLLVAAVFLLGMSAFAANARLGTPRLPHKFAPRPPVYLDPASLFAQIPIGFVYMDVGEAPKQMAWQITRNVPAIPLTAWTSGGTMCCGDCSRSTVSSTSGTTAASWAFDSTSTTAQIQELDAETKHIDQQMKQLAALMAEYRRRREAQGRESTQ